MAASTIKTSLIRLAPSADWRAAVARVRGGRQERVIVFWPAKGGPRNARLVLHLMQRRSLRKQVPLAVVTSNPYLRTQSEKLGLPLFATTRQARNAEWGIGQPKESWRSVTRQSRIGSPALRNNARELRSLSTKRRAAALH